MERAMNENIVSALGYMPRATYDKKENKVILRQTLTEALDAFDKLCLTPKRGESPLDMGARNTCSTHAQVINSSESFCGGSVADLSKPVSDAEIADFNKQVQALAKSTHFQKLRLDLGQRMKRKRSFDSYDGELVIDRLNEMAPFQLRKKRLAKTPTLKIVTNMNFAAMVSAESIRDYAKACAALVTVIESTGIACELVMRKETAHANSADTKTEQLITVKKCGEYMPTQRLLKTYSPNFMRRVMFGNICLCAKLFHEKSSVSGSLGKPVYVNQAVASTKGTLSIGNIGFETKHDELMKAIMAAI